MHVVSILAVTIILGASLFQWKLDNGAENSVFGYERLAIVSKLKGHCGDSQIWNWKVGKRNEREESEQRVGIVVQSDIKPSF